MKKVKFKAIFYDYGKDRLHTLNGEEYDEFTYYTSIRMNPDFKFSIGYALYDKKTGLAVVIAKSKREAIEKYIKVAKRYENIRNSKNYLKQIKRYEKLLKETL